MSDNATQFTIDLPVTGQSRIDAAAASVDSLAVRLDSASKASQAASDGVKVAEAAYSKAEANADKLARALERVGVAADAQKAKLRVATDLGDTSAIARAEAQIRELARQEEQLAGKVTIAKTTLTAQATALDKLRGAAKTTGEEGVKWEKLERGLGRFEGPLAEAGARVARLAGGWRKLTASIGEDGAWLAAAVGVTALVTAVVAAAAAIATMTVRVAEWGIGLADANRTNVLLAQGMTRSAIGGLALNDQLNSLSKRLPLTREELASTAQGLVGMGLRGGQLAKALENAATRAARIKFGPEFEEQMLSLTEQSKVFQSNLAQTFGGLHTDALMRGLQTLVRLFDSSTESGRAMKVVFESFFQPLVDGAANAAPKVERFFLQAEILALKALIAVKPYGSTILKVGEAFLLGAAIIGGVFAAAVGVALYVVGAAVAAVGLLAYGFYRAEVAVESFGRLVGSTLRSINLLEIGKAMIEGLAEGIRAGGAAVVAAVTGAARSAVDAAKSVLGIHSPSKVFAEIGMQTGAGMREGVDRSAPAVGNALERMSSPATHARAGSPLPIPAVSSAPSGDSVNMQGATFNFYGVEGAEDAESRFAGILTRILEGDGAQLGGLAVTT